MKLTIGDRIDGGHRRGTVIDLPSRDTVKIKWDGGQIETAFWKDAKPLPDETLVSVIDMTKIPESKVRYTLTWSERHDPEHSPRHCENFTDGVKVIRAARELAKDTTVYGIIVRRESTLDWRA